MPASVKSAKTAATSVNWTHINVGDLLESLATPLATAIRRSLHSGDHALVLSLGYDPTTDAPPDLIKRNWLAANLLKKATWLDVGSKETRRAACLESWKEDERLNHITNQRLRTSICSTETSGDSLIFEMRRKIDRVLEDLDLDEVFKHCGFSSGSSTRLPRRLGQPHNKIGGRPHVTPSALPYAIALARSSPTWSSYCWDYRGLNPREWFQLVPGGTWFTVPKSVKTDRSCEKQPDMNLLLQKSIGKFMRIRLKRVGVDLDDQSTNARLALESSLSNLLSTIDLSSASNSVTRQLVRRLLNDEWFDLLDALRCEWVEVDGVWTRLGMFSSMGNGFTFELESLIFWAATSAVCDLLDPSVVDTRIAIYGDDIVVPKAASGALIELLAYLGFRVNWDKSFISGPFRESCGTHGYRGVDVTPFKIEDSLDLPEERIRVANKMRAWSACGDICDPRLEHCWIQLAAPILRFAGPSSDGDVALHTPRFKKNRLVWVRSKEEKINHDPDRQESGLIARLLLNDQRIEDDTTHADASRLLRGGRFRDLIQDREPSLSIRRQGDRYVYLRKSPLTEANAGPYKAKSLRGDRVRDTSVPNWLHEIG